MPIKICDASSYSLGLPSHLANNAIALSHYHRLEPLLETFPVVTPVHSRLLSDIEGNPIHEQQTANTG
jgi:hypothetical protein